ncbi:MAG: carboxypeptidase-like regulatory domain-containing protein, partial [Prevotella sp.]|nr:carboxypeptidase-like regulatory domain-containing protein [Prevotella sp.]
MEKRLLMFLAGLFLSIGMAVAQTQVKGTVVSSEDGEPVVGASVMISGTKTGTITDAEGKFSLNATNGTKLVVSYLGMRVKTVTASTSDDMKIKLDPDNKVLDEVVVTAMGITREKKALGYASQVLNAKDLNTAGTSSLANAMQ